MSTTVTVALITALSTLTAGAIASVTSVIIHLNQMNKDRERFQTELSDKQAAQRKAIRRDAYVQLLNSVQETDKLIKKCWELFPQSEKVSPTREEILVAGTSLDSLISPMNIVKLEGPQSVVDASDEMSAACRSELLAC